MTMIMTFALVVLAGSSTATSQFPPGSLVYVPAPYRPESVERWPDIEQGRPGQWPRTCEQTGQRLGKNLSAINPLEFAGNVAVCMISPPPQTAPFGDAEWHVLTERLSYRIGPVRDIVVIPKGFVTDFASIPDFTVLRAKFPKDGQYLSAAILHDYMYWDQRCTREQADNIFKNEMLDFGVPLDEVMLIYAGVSAAGQRSWKDNKHARTQSPRIISDADLRALLTSPARAGQTWEELRTKLESRGIRGTPDPGNYDITQVCRRAAEETPEQVLERKRRAKHH